MLFVYGLLAVIGCVVLGSFVYLHDCEIVRHEEEIDTLAQRIAALEQRLKAEREAG